MRWTLQKEAEVLEGEINTSEAPSPQFALAIVGTTYVISAALYCMLKCAIVVAIAGVACYVAEVVGTKIKNNSRSANYFPAYNAFGNVYVATGIGISQKTAIMRIKNVQHVWAKNAQYAYNACVMAIPIGAAEWGWHGNRKTSSGYYPHYYAVKSYKKNGQYQHTGAHCWYI